MMSAASFSVSRKAVAQLLSNDDKENAVPPARVKACKGENFRGGLKVSSEDRLW